MMEKRMTAVAWDFIKDREGIYPIVRAMGEIAGTASIQIASEYLSTDKGGQGFMLGGISGVAPAEVVVIGAGTVGEFATRAALGVGASVKVFDKSIYRLRRLQSSIGQRLVDQHDPAGRVEASPDPSRRGHRRAAPRARPDAHGGHRGRGGR
jgi:alanine dehydrogenase